MNGVLRCAIALGALAVATQPAAAMTVGEFRQAYNALHALDPIPQKARAAFIAAHRAELDLARARLEDSVMVRDTILETNGILVSQGLHPFLCNYDLEEIDDQVDLYGWVEEFRGEALEKFKLVAGPKTDALLDLVDFHEVIAHKMLEKFPCPIALQTQPLKGAAAEQQAAPPHQHH